MPQPLVTGPLKLRFDITQSELKTLSLFYRQPEGIVAVEGCWSIALSDALWGEGQQLHALFKGKLLDKSPADVTLMVLRCPPGLYSR
jgi:hypothetical protein